MKYWYLKGGDVLGPLTAQEIVSDDGFTAESLVCPEPNSADETYWKTPDKYADDFASFLPESEIPAQPEQPENVAVAPAAEPIADADVEPLLQPVEDTPVVIPQSETDIDLIEEAARIEEISPEETIHTSNPIIAAKEDNLLADIPASGLLGPKPEEAVQPVNSIEQEAQEVFNDSASNNDPVENIEDDIPSVNALEEEAEAATEAAAEQEPLVEDMPKEEIFAEKPEVKKISAAPVEKPAAKIVEKPSSIIDSSPVETFTAGSSVVRISGGGEEVPQPKPNHAEIKTVERPKVKEKSFFSAMEEDKPAASAEEETGDFAFPGEENASFSELMEENYTENDKKLFEVKKAASPNHAASKNDEPLIPPQTADKVFTSTMPTTNGKILSSSDGRLEQGKPRNDTLYLLVLSMFVFIAIAVFMTFFVDNKKTDNREQITEEIAAQKPIDAAPKPVVQGVDEGIASPAVPAAKPVNPMPQQGDTPAVSAPVLTHQAGTVMEQDNEAAKNQAQNLVQKYLLDEKRGTIAEYFQKTYAGSYQTRWTASPLYGDTYIVEYFASKVRSEPIIYLFRVDVKKGKVTGALNNVTLDLLSK